MKLDGEGHIYRGDMMVHSKQKFLPEASLSKYAYACCKSKFSAIIEKGHSSLKYFKHCMFIIIKQKYKWVKVQGQKCIQISAEFE